MTSSWIKAIAIAMVWLASPLLHAAGSDCGRAVSAAEKKICGDSGLSASDDQMTRSFLQASRRAGAHSRALVLDQRHWFAERDRQVNDEGHGDAAYERRIAFLDHLFVKADVSSPLLDAIAESMEHSDNAKLVQGLIWKQANSVFHIASDQVFDGALSVPFDRASLDQYLEDDVANFSRHDLYLLEKEHLGGLLTKLGTANCEAWNLFRWQQGRVDPVEMPDLFDDSCPQGGALVEYGGKAYAMQVMTLDVDVIVVRAQAYSDGIWGNVAELELHFEDKRHPPEWRCEGNDCSTLAEKAAGVLTRYDRDGDKSGLIAGFSPEQGRVFDALLAHQHDIEKKSGTHVLYEFPTFEHGHGQGTSGFQLITEQYHEFDDTESTFFPLNFHGELLIGNIGHGYFAWHPSDNWLLAAWRWNGKEFVPVLGMWMERERGQFLLAGRTH